MLPFSVAVSNEELAANIEQFDEDKYRKAIDAFQKKYGVLEDGRASERVVDVIEKVIN